jgi:hypothetical protein
MEVMCIVRCLHLPLKLRLLLRVKCVQLHRICPLTD